MDNRNGVRRGAYNPLAKFNNAYDELTQDMVEDEQSQEQSTAIIAAPDGTIVFGDYAITPVGLTLPDDITPEEWERVGTFIVDTFESSTSWAIGDWAEHANKHWGWTYKQIAQVKEYPEKTLITYASVCRSYPMSIRNRHATFGHHRVVMNHPMREQLLEQAAAENWTISQLKKAMPKPPKTGKRPTPSAMLDRYLRFSDRNQQFFEKFASKAHMAGRGERLQISQMIDRDIARLEELKRKIEGNE